jgi:hypothetical protein
MVSAGIYGEKIAQGRESSGLEAPTCLAGMRTGPDLRRDGVALTAALALSVVTVLVNARRTFDFFDMSGFLDGGYRVYRGQRLYVDFFYHAGPVQPALHAAFFHIFGFCQTAVLAHLGTVMTIFGAATYYLARAGAPPVGLPPLGAAILTVIAVLGFAGPISHPFYDQTAFMFIAVGLALYQWHLRTATIRSASLAGVGAGILAGLSFMAKANEGAVGGLALLALFAMGPYPRAAVSCCIAGGLIGGLAPMVPLASPYDFINSAFIAYPTANRLTNFSRLGLALIQCLYVPVAACGLGMAAFGGRRFVRERRHDLAILGAICGVSIFSGWTGSTQLPAFTLGAGMGLVYTWLIVRSLLASPETRPSPPKVRIMVALAGLVSLLVAVYIADKTWKLETWRWRNVLDGSDNPVHSDYAFTTPAFAGWRCDGKVGEGVDAAVRFLAKNARPEERLFVFPDATFIYGLLGRDSWISAPMIFQANQGPPSGEGTRRLRRSLLSHPPEWIVYHNQIEVSFYSAHRLTVWLGLEILFKQYEVVSTTREVSVLRLKNR